MKIIGILRTLDREIRESALVCDSVCDMIRHFGFKPSGTTYKAFKKIILELGIATSGWRGQAHSRGKTLPKRFPISDYLHNNPKGRYLKSYRLKLRLLEEGLLEYRCSAVGCLVSGEWLGLPLALHLDHVNGDPLDNRLENLRILCPNCHTQTDTYCGKNHKKLNESRAITYVNAAGPPKKKACGKSKKNNSCILCGSACKNKYCSYACARQASRKTSRPGNDELQAMVQDTGYSQVGRSFGVSDNTIRKWLHTE